MHYDETTMRDCIYGLAVGDALGVPHEFAARDSFHCEGMESGGAHDQPAGTWSDDTSMALCVADSIRRLGRIDISDISARMLEWYIAGEYACGDEVFDIGYTTKCALESGMPGDGLGDCGNGSLIRSAPIAALDVWYPDDVKKVSSITHSNPLATGTCVAFCHCIELAKRWGYRAAFEIDKCYGFITRRPKEYIWSDGYCVSTFEAALWCFANTGTYEDCVLKAVNLGSDADSVAAAAGALAGVAYGFDAIPSEWIRTLRGKDIIDACLYGAD